MAGSSPPPLEKSGPASTVSPGSGIVQTRGSRLWGQGEGSRRAVTSSDTPPCRRVLADRKPSRILFPPAGYQRPLDQGIKPNSHWGVPGERDPGGDTNVAATVRPPVRQSTRPVQPYAADHGNGTAYTPGTTAHPGTKRATGPFVGNLQRSFKC